MINEMNGKLVADKFLHAINFLKGYSEQEPEYTEADIIKEPSAEYKKWKRKGK